MERGRWDSMRGLAAAVRRVFKPSDTRFPDEVVVHSWNEFVDIYEKRKRANWRLPVGGVDDIFEFQEMQLGLPMIEGMRTSHGVTAKVALRVSVRDGKIFLFNGSRVFRGSPSEAFDFLNELYDISAVPD